MSDQDGPFIRRSGDPGDPRPGQRRRVPPGASYEPPQAWSQSPQARDQAPDDQRGPRGTHEPGRYAPRQQPQPFGPEQSFRSEQPFRSERPPRPGGFRRDDPRLGTYEGGHRSSPPRPPVGPQPDPRGRVPRRRRRRLPIVRTLLILLLVIVVGIGGLVFYYDSKLNRVDALSSYPGRVRDTPGINWLLVGSDSRANLSAEQKQQLATGDTDGKRTDTIMLIHIPSSGKAMIISIPRDLYVTIPGQGPHKINAAFNGGPKLLVQTIETLTKVHIDHYAEVGFGGFDKLVDSVGGVNICIDQRLRDPKAGLNLRPGCQDLDGQQALGLVRTRAFPNADLERVVNQRKFLSALMAKASGLSTVLNPFRLFPFVSGTVSAITVDNGDHIWNLGTLAWALRSSPLTTTTPNSGPENTDDGDALGVGDNTTAFFEYIAKDVPVPTDLLSNSGGVIN